MRVTGTSGAGQQSGAGQIEARELSRLIGLIYDCAIDPSGWDSTIERLRAAFDCQTVGLMLHDVPANRFLLSKLIGIEPYWLNEQQKHVAELNARLAAAFASELSPDEPFIVSRHFPAGDVETSPYFQEWAKPQGLVDAMQYFLIGSETRFAGFGIGRHARHGLITEREVTLGGLLLHHIRRAVTISDVLDIRTVERERMAEVLDSLRCAVLLTDAQGGVLHANKTAEFMLRDGRVIRDAHGFLQSTLPSASAELQQAIAIAAKDEAQIGSTGLAVRLTEDSPTPSFAHVLPLSGGEIRARLDPAAAAAIFIGVPLDQQRSAELVATAFALTPAETRVLRKLLAGRSLAEAAAELEITANTARSHLDRIFSKTAVTRQAELITLASRLAPPIATDGSQHQSMVRP